MRPRISNVVQQRWLFAITLSQYHKALMCGVIIRFIVLAHHSKSLVPVIDVFSVFCIQSFLQHSKIPPDWERHAGCTCWKTSFMVLQMSVCTSLQTRRRKNLNSWPSLDFATLFGSKWLEIINKSPCRSFWHSLTTPYGNVEARRHSSFIMWSIWNSSQLKLQRLVVPEVVALTSYCYNYITCLKVPLNVSILFKKCICFLFPDMKSLHRYVLQKMKLELPVGNIALAQKLLVCPFLTLFCRNTVG